MLLEINAGSCRLISFLISKNFAKKNFEFVLELGKWCLQIQDQLLMANLCKTYNRSICGFLRILLIVVRTCF